MTKLTHVDEQGKARMVDVSEKDITQRSATATATVKLSPETFRAVTENRAAKGDVLAVARVAGIQAAKRTSELIPLCHPVGLNHVEVSFQLNEDDHAVTVQATAVCTARTGVEMEALTACSVAALTIYDMLKAIQKDIVITELMLLRKTGGRSGEYRRSDS